MAIAIVTINVFCLNFIILTKTLSPKAFQYFISSVSLYVKIKHDTWNVDMCSMGAKSPSAISEIHNTMKIQITISLKFRYVDVR